MVSQQKNLGSIDVLRPARRTGPTGSAEPLNGSTHGAKRCRSRGKRVVSRMFSTPTSRAMSRTNPIAKLPCGGIQASGKRRGIQAPGLPTL
jgi:hypothetical protein